MAIRCVSIKLYSLRRNEFLRHFQSNVQSILSLKKTALQWHIGKIVAKHNKSAEYRDTRCPCAYINRYHKYDIKVNRVMAFTLTGIVGRGSII